MKRLVFYSSAVKKGEYAPKSVLDLPNRLFLCGTNSRGIIDTSPEIASSSSPRAARRSPKNIRFVIIAAILWSTKCQKRSFLRFDLGTYAAVGLIERD